MLTVCQRVHLFKRLILLDLLFKSVQLLDNLHRNCLSIIISVDKPDCLRDNETGKAVNALSLAL